MHNILNNQVELVDKFEAIFNHAPDVLATIDLQHRIIMCNLTTRRIFGYEPAELLNKDLALLYANESEYQRHSQLLFNPATQEQSVSVEATLKRKDGTLFSAEVIVTIIRDRDALAQGFIGQIRDITERKHAEQKIHNLAYFDNLTGLANRQLLSDRLEHALASAQRNNTQVAMLFIDLDRFKLVNDSLGHAAGDELLKVIALRLQACIRRVDTAARLGGDEFILILEGLENAEQAAHVASKVLIALAEPILLGKQSFVVSASIGISRSPTDGAEFNTLLKHADLALQKAKQLGRHQFCFYDAELNVNLGERLQLETELHQALVARELLLYYQPQVDLRSGAVTGVEALLRWASSDSWFYSCQ